MVINGSLAEPDIHFELRYYLVINELFITNFYCIYKRPVFVSSPAILLSWIT